MSDLELEELESLVERYAERKEDPSFMIAARTGIVSLDLNLGGGLPSGIVEVAGEEGTGKTGLVGQIAGHNQRAGRVVAWLQTEKVDPFYLDQLGVLRRYLPLISEQDIPSFFKEFQKAVLIIDSLTALRNSWEDWNAGVFEFLLELQATLRPGQCVIVTNHVRARLSAEPGRVFAGGTESAGRNIGDLFNTRLMLSRKNVTETDYTQVVNILSNVLASPCRFLELAASKGHGVDRWQDLVRTGVSLGVVTQRGSSLHFRGELLGNGIASAILQLRQCSELEEALVRGILEEVS